MPTDKPTRGRPRSVAAEAAIVAATLAELADHGYQALTIESVARRADVGRPTVYRRWPNKELLVVHALSCSVPALTAGTATDPVERIRAVVIGFIGEVTTSPAARAVLAVHAEAGHRPELAAALQEQYLSPRAGLLEELFAAARTAGRIRVDVTDEQLRDLLFGPPIYRWLITARAPDLAELDALMRFTIDAVTVT